VQQRLEICASRADPSHAGAVERGLRCDQEGIVTSIQGRSCVECSSNDADLPVVEETGRFTGWICRDCDRRLRHRHVGWKRRIRRRVRRFMG
jgi:hypothetical protein